MSEYETEEQTEDINQYAQDTSDEDSGSENEATQEADRLTNLQREFERKLNNTTEATQKQLQQMADIQTKLLEQLNSYSSPQSATEDESELENLMYTDPKAYAAKIEERATKRAVEQVSQQSQAQSQKMAALQGAINESIAQYPELNKSEHPLTQKVYSLVGSDVSKVDPKDLKLAVYQAAMEMNIAPISKRTKTVNKDDFSGLSSQGQKSKPVKKGGNIPKGTQLWAEALGLDLSDPTTQKRLEARSKRDWLRKAPVKRDLKKDLEK